MADAPELPEAKDPFERSIAMSIAIMAVVLSFISTKGDNAKTDAILKTSEASNQWAYFQAKSIKQSLSKMESDVLELTTAAANPETVKKIADLKAKAEEYEKEKGQTQKDALDLKKDADASSAINDKCDLSALLLQIAVVLASVAILTRWKGMWFASLALGAAGGVFGVLAYF